MGSWNDSDGITQLPILYGDKVRLFILLKQDNNRGGGGYCYSNEEWCPLGPAIIGTYDDYGGIENIIENQDAEILTKQIRKNWVSFEKKYQEVSDIEKMPLSEIVHWIERGDAKLNLNGKVRTLGLMMVLEDVYQSMINFKSVTTERHDSGTYEYKKYDDIIKLQIKDWFINLSGLYENKDDFSNQDLKFEILHYLLDDSYIPNNALQEHKKQLNVLAENGSTIEDEKVINIFQSVFEMIKFHYFMERARKTYYPQSGKGSQDSELEPYMQLIMASNKIIKDRIDKEQEESEDLPIADENGFLPYMIEHNQKRRGT